MKKSYSCDAGVWSQMPDDWRYKCLRGVAYQRSRRARSAGGKVERLHCTDEKEFYQLLIYKDDVDLEQKRVQWQSTLRSAGAFFSHYGPTPDAEAAGHL